VNPRGFPRRGVERQRLTGLFERSEASGQWRPQTGDQKDRARNRDQVLGGRNGVGKLRQEPRAPEIDQRNPEAEPDEQEPDSRPTMGKGGEQTLHGATQLDRNELRGRSMPLKGCVRIPRSRDIGRLQLDDSALESNGHGVRPVIRAKFGEDVSDVALDGFFGERQL
jgi:hypothetical protein